ncbi:MAG: metallophosphoesterase [Actinomycetota bacterium]
MPSTMRTVAAVTAGLGAAFIAGGVAESRAYTVRLVQLPVLPIGSRSLRVLHLSDLHLTPRQRRAPAWLRGLADLQPDLVVNTGDNLAHPDAVPTVLDALDPLLKLPGVFVLGNNDYFGPRLKNPARYLLRHEKQQRLHGAPLPVDRLVEGFREAGWLDLTNRRDRLTVAGITLSFVGVDDAHLGYDVFPATGPDGPPVDLPIGVTHAPYTRVLDAMVNDQTRLILAGHTHGGQLRLPKVGALTANCDLPLNRARGVSRWWAGAGSTASLHPPQGVATSWMHVSAGVGTSPYTPVRFCCRPEATMLSLVPTS